VERAGKTETKRREGFRGWENTMPARLTVFFSAKKTDRTTPWPEACSTRWKTNVYMA
jgi:hypothetical protein